MEGKRHLHIDGGLKYTMTTATSCELVLVFYFFKYPFEKHKSYTEKGHNSTLNRYLISAGQSEVLKMMPVVYIQTLIKTCRFSLYADIYHLKCSS